MGGWRMRWIWIDGGYILRCCPGVGALKKWSLGRIVLLFMIDLDAWSGRAV